MRISVCYDEHLTVEISFIKGHLRMGKDTLMHNQEAGDEDGSLEGSVGNHFAPRPSDIFHNDSGMLGSEFPVPTMMSDEDAVTIELITSGALW